MKLMVVKVDDAREVFAQWGITGSDVDEAFATLPAFDLMTTKAVTITDYVRGLDEVKLERFLNALLSEYVDYGDGRYISLDETKWVLDQLTPPEVAEALANHKGGK